MKMKWKKRFLMIFGLCFALSVYIAYDVFVLDENGLVESVLNKIYGQAAETTAEKVTSIEVGQVYEEYTYFKFVDESHFVAYEDNSDYTESDLEEAREDAESDEVYPEIWMSEGTYTKSGDNYYLTTTREVTIQFASAEAVKNKSYFALKEENLIQITANQEPQLQLKNGAYIYHFVQYSLNADGTTTATGTVTDISISKANHQTIPDSINAMLADYTYSEQ